MENFPAWAATMRLFLTPVELKRLWTRLAAPIRLARTSRWLAGRRGCELNLSLFAR
jgi:hypothetical protein